MVQSFASLTLGAILLLPSHMQTRKPDTDLRVTVIGCIQRTQPPADDVLGATVAPPGQTKYVLSNITLVPATDTAPAEATLVTQAVKMYRLDDAAASMVGAHVGARVQITGTVDLSPAGASGVIDPPSQAAQAPTLRVQTLKTISQASNVCGR